MKIKKNDKLAGTYSNGIQSWEFRGVVEGIHHDTAGGNFSMACIKLDESFDNRGYILATLDANGELADGKYEVAVLPCA